ncbi:MAG: hypothetical protein EA364_09055 [Balneolaceae bacterium]|nr:MAG: hypothetical protein EA364_09055 [Balneolaceae bacterium]
MASIGSVFRQSNPYEDAIKQIIQLESIRKNELQTLRNTEQSRKTALTTVDANMTALRKTLNNFASPVDSPIRQQLANSSNESVIAVRNVSGTPFTGSYSLNVAQIARQDIVLSGVLSADGSDFTGGGGNLAIQIGSSDPLTLDIDTTGLDNRQALNAIAAGINETMDGRVQAVVYETTSGSLQLSLKSTESGSDNAINITEASGNFALLGLSNLTPATDLDAVFSIDGITITRSSNIVSDVIQGVTFELRSNTPGDVTLQVENDLDSSVEAVQSFIKDYNNLILDIRTKTVAGNQNSDSGLLRRDRVLRQLTVELRYESIQDLPGFDIAGISKLSDLGIEVRRDGTLNLKDEAVLKDILDNDREGIRAFFESENGFSARILGKIDAFNQGNDNILSSLQKGADQRIKLLDNRISAQERFLIRREAQLRDEFTRLQQVVIQGQAQFDEIIRMQSMFF